MDIPGKYGQLGARRLVLSLLLFLLGLPFLHAQHVILNYFLAEAGNQGVSLSWEIKAGSTCNGIRIERSVDYLQWEEIGDIQGICGSPGYAESFFFLDEAPTPNRINYYRLELGTEGKTSVVSAFYVFGGDQGYTLLTGISGEVEILVPNYDSKEFQLEIFELNGQLVYRANYTSDRVSLGFLYSSYHIYLFRLVFQDGQTIIGRFLL